MLSIIKAYKKDWKIPLIGLIFILIAYSFSIRDTRIEDLENKIQFLETRLKKVNKDYTNLYTYLEEIEASDSIDKEETQRIWESLAIVRNNFIALGHGYHLKPKDFCPPFKGKW